MSEGRVGFFVRSTSASFNYTVSTEQFMKILTLDVSVSVTILSFLNLSCDV